MVRLTSDKFLKCPLFSVMSYCIILFISYYCVSTLPLKPERFICCIEEGIIRHILPSLLEFIPVCCMRKENYNLKGTQHNIAFLHHLSSKTKHINYPRKLTAELNDYDSFTLPHNSFWISPTWGVMSDWKLWGVVLSIIKIPRVIDFKGKETFPLRRSNLH